MKKGEGMLARFLQTIEGMDALKPALGHLLALTTLLPKIVAEAAKIVDGMDDGEDKVGATAQDVARHAKALVDELWESEESLVSLVDQLAGLASRLSSDARFSAGLAGLSEAAGRAADAAIERAVDLSQGESEGRARSLAVAEVILQRILERLADSAFQWKDRDVDE